MVVVAGVSVREVMLFIRKSSLRFEFGRDRSGLFHYVLQSLDGLATGQYKGRTKDNGEDEKDL